MYGSYNYRKKTLNITNEEYSCRETARFVFCYDGRESASAAELFDGEELSADWAKAFIGPFLLIAYEKKTGKLLITQHAFGSGRELYLLNAPDRLLFDGGRLSESIVELPESVESAPTGKLQAEYYTTVALSLYEETKDIEGPIAQALSSGYDSNCMLFMLDKLWPERRKETYSIGGVRGVDETKVAEEIAKTYPNTEFASAYVSQSTHDAFDEIVFRLEGSVAQIGIFLQYELARLLDSHSVKTVLVGECADQVFNIRTYKPIKSEDMFLYIRRNPRECAAYFILKKNRLMLSSFGIEARYPFLSQSMLELGAKTCELNKHKKRYHIEQCMRMLPSEISERIGKQGGATDPSTLFANDERIYDRIIKMKYYSPKHCLASAGGLEESLMQYYVSLKSVESFEKQFCDKPSM
ncbi:MAG: hypothetical protein II871_04440 [Clostridia bacterium]|nr:hypothetical protein [Clostridia bacterium]